MESDFSPQQILAAAERGAVAPWIDYPRTSPWYFPGMGAWVGAWILAMTELHGLGLVLAELALLAVAGGALAWYHRVRGTWPTMKGAPAEFRAALRGFLVGALALAVAVVTLVIAFGGFAAAPAAFVGVTCGLFWYEKAYEGAAARTRARVEAAG